jgi:hypothetical protein
MAYYRSEKIDNLMKNPVMEPRLAGLAQRALRHYLGDSYDPKIFNPLREITFREFISDTIKNKIKTRQPYNWILIDYVFREMLKRWEIEILPEETLKRKVRIWERKDSLYYADELIEEVMNDKKSYPRYRHLARKALKHYLGNLYFPKTLDPDVEFQIRDFIYTCVHIKVINRVPYHWEFIDNYLRRLLHQAGFTHLEFDNVLVEKRYHGGKFDPPTGIFDTIH